MSTAQSGNGAACLGDHTCVAGEGACPADVNCVESGNTAAECTVDCTAVASVSTAQSGNGAACLGDHTCVAGEGACPADVACVETGNTAADCLSTCAVATATETTAQSGAGAACVGDHKCVAGEGACPAAVVTATNTTGKAQTKTPTAGTGVITTAKLKKSDNKIPVNNIAGIKKGDSVTITNQDGSKKDTTTVVQTTSGQRGATAGYLTVADKLANDYDIGAQILITAQPTAADNDPTDTGEQAPPSTSGLSDLAIAMIIVLGLLCLIIIALLYILDNKKNGTSRVMAMRV